jgi:hypothetical protein
VAMMIDKRVVDRVRQEWDLPAEITDERIAETLQYDIYRLHFAWRDFLTQLRQELKGKFPWFFRK